MRDLIITEGVMGYYDGLAQAAIRMQPVPMRWQMRLICRYCFLCRAEERRLRSCRFYFGNAGAFRENRHIKGILLNRCSGMLYPRLKEMIERELSKHGYAIPVVGYMPEDPLFHLERPGIWGSVLPEEIAAIRQQLFRRGSTFENNQSIWNGSVRSQRAGRFPSGNKGERHVPGCVREEQDPGADRRGKRPCVFCFSIMKTTSGFCENSGVN